MAKLQLKLQLKQFAADARKLAVFAKKARKALPKEIDIALESIGQKWEAGAKLRVPYDTGELQASIAHEVEDLDDGVHMLGVGSNVEYAVFMEFGTSNWARGAVLALGTGEVITDDQAIKTWKALEEDGRKPAPEQEQGPWLRPAFWAMGNEPQNTLDRAVEKILQ